MWPLGKHPLPLVQELPSASLPSGPRVRGMVVRIAPMQRYSLWSAPDDPPAQPA